MLLFLFMLITAPKGDHVRWDPKPGSSQIYSVVLDKSDDGSGSTSRCYYRQIWECESVSASRVDYKIVDDEQVVLNAKNSIAFPQFGPVNRTALSLQRNGTPLDPQDCIRYLQIPEADLSAGVHWTYTIADRDNETQVKCVFVGKETVDGCPTYRFDADCLNKAVSQSGKATATYWLSSEDGSIVKSLKSFHGKEDGKSITLKELSQRLDLRPGKSLVVHAPSINRPETYTLSEIAALTNGHLATTERTGIFTWRENHSGSGLIQNFNIKLNAFSLDGQEQSVPKEGVEGKVHISSDGEIQSQSLGKEDIDANFPPLLFMHIIRPSRAVGIGDQWKSSMNEDVSLGRPDVSLLIEFRGSEICDDTPTYRLAIDGKMTVQGRETKLKGLVWISRKTGEMIRSFYHKDYDSRQFPGVRVSQMCAWIKK